VPRGKAATHYQSPPATDPRAEEAPRRALAEHVAAAARRLRRPVPTLGDRYRRAADELAAAAREGETIPPEAVAFLQSHHGLVEAEPGVVVLTGTPGVEERALDGFGKELAEVLQQGAWTRLGIGLDRRPQESVIVIALWEQLVEMRPIPRSLPAGGRARIDGRVLSRHRNVQLVVTAPAGTVGLARLAVDGASFRGEVACGTGDGRYQVEIVGSDESGPSVLANFPVYCGFAPPAELKVEPERRESFRDTAEAEQALLGLLNHTRKVAGLRPLAWDDRLARVARAHSDEMARTGVVAHVSPKTGDAVARVRDAGLNPTFVGENVGRAHSIKGAHQGLMASPGHRANILHRSPTHVGIGVVPVTLDQGRTLLLFVTEVFAAGI
jgi:uncharacterized protein YkwD